MSTLGDESEGDDQAAAGEPSVQAELPGQHVAARPSRSFQPENNGNAGQPALGASSTAVLWHLL
ncbi:hypothetical protein GCM10010429_58470 [Micromonospora olivasterospora]